MADDSMYPDSGGMSDAASPSESESSPEQQGNEEEGAQTALIPKALLGGKKFNVGDEVSLKIVHEYEDEVEVEYAKADGPEENREGMRGSDGAQMRDSMRGMSSFGGEG